MRWVPLHVHSQYSILRSTASVEALVERAKALGLSALALTDEGNLHGAVDFYKACTAAGIKPLIGCKLNVAPTGRQDKRKIPGEPAGYPLLFLVKDEEGYRNLCRLSSLAYLEGFYYTPRIDRELIERHHRGLICLSGPVSGRISQLLLKGDEKYLEEIAFLQGLFKDDFYLQVERHRMLEEEIRADGMEQEAWVIERYHTRVEEEEKVIQTLKQLSLPLVATHEIRYMERNDWRAHEILMNIQTGEPCVMVERDSRGNFKQKVANPRRDILSTHNHHFKSPEEMAQIFADMPEAIAESARIAEKCSFAFDFSKRYYPAFVPPHLEGKSYTKEERHKESELFLRQRCFEEIPRRYGKAELDKVQEKYPGRDPLDVVHERLEYELGVITSKGMCDYLLIVYDFIDWAKRKGIAIGPGRGSGVGAIVSYLLAITDIEPLRFSLIFERFINPERPSYPDIDVDICMDRRSEVIEYTESKYGKECVAHIITFGTMKAKMAIRDVGRMLSIELAKVNAIAKLVPEDLNMTLERALEIDPELKTHYEADEEVRELIDLSKRLEGSVRNTSIHAAGLIISDGSLFDRVPLCAAKESTMMVTQYAMKPVEYVGMLKIDFLGLKTLTSIQHCAEAINKREENQINWMRLPLDDTKAFNVVNEGRTLGVFQLESSSSSTDLARQVHIDRFEEMIAVNALIRPGPLEMSPSYIARKHKREAIVIDHPLLEEILAETYGISVYQEQVMQIARRLAGYSLGEGDLLRKAMGKKDHEEMARQREKFKKGAKAQGIEESVAMQIFDKMEKFASYGFNKSHAAAYGYLTYATAYLKAHYPSDWMAALLTSDRDDLDKVAKIIRECQALGIAILPPDINESSQVFVATSRGIRFALTAIKGVGEGVVNAILSERARAGSFGSLQDFLTRMCKAKLGRKPVELLIETGCFDFIGWRREALLALLPSLTAEIEKRVEENEGGVLLLSFMESPSEQKAKEPPQVPETPKLERMKRERELLGFYLTGHPLDSFTHEIESLGCTPLAQLAHHADGVADGAAALCAFLAEAVEVRLASKTQRKFARLVISDGGERFELMIWPDHFERWGRLLTEGQPLVAVLQVEKQEEGSRLLCHWLEGLSELPPDARESAEKILSRIQGKPRRFKKPAAAPVPAPQRDEPSRGKLVIEVDAKTLRLSHIVVLKKLFRASSGDLPVRLVLREGERRIASIAISGKWGVKWCQELDEKLQRLPGLVRLALAD